MSRQKEGQLDLSFTMGVAKSTGFESCVENLLIRYMTLGKVQRQSCSNSLSPSVLSMNRGVYSEAGKDGTQAGGVRETQVLNVVTLLLVALLTVLPFPHSKVGLR